MGTRYRRIAALLLAVLLLLCTVCGTVPAQPEDTGDKDQYMTDPVPEGKPAPVEPQDVVMGDDAELTCTFSISCATILDNWDKCDDSKKPLRPCGRRDFAVHHRDLQRGRECVRCASACLPGQ